MIVRTARGSAAAFHARVVDDAESDGTNELWVHEVDRPALVLGSSQRPELVDVEAAEAAGVEVVRRRSGGGAVWLAPHDVTWVDVIVRAGQPGWSADIHAPMHLIGETVARVLAGGLAGETTTGETQLVTVHRGPMVTTPWSTLVCFDGVGPGEVCVGDRKLLGISQRRTRSWARLQCCWYHRHDPADVVRWMRPGVAPAASELRTAATIPASMSSQVIDALAARFAAAG